MQNWFTQSGHRVKGRGGGVVGHVAHGSSGEARAKVAHSALVNSRARKPVIVEMC